MRPGPVAPAASPRRVPCVPPLTPAQEQVVALVAEGLTMPAIAGRLGVSVNTVKFHAKLAAQRIPGTLTARSRFVLWWQGADLRVLSGLAGSVPGSVAGAYPIDGEAAQPGR